MGEIAALWGYQENQDMDQLGQKLLCATLELEKLKAEAVDEMSKNKEYIKQLIILLKCAVQERDEARNQLHKLLNNGRGAATLPPHNPQLFLESVKPAKANSGKTECTSASDTYNCSPHSPPPVNSVFFDGVPSARISNINLLPNNQPLSDGSNGVLGNNNNNQINSGALLPEFDNGSIVIDGIVKGRALPQNGKFLQAVLHAGPLLQTLLVAGPLPRWRNPPQIQPLHIPPVSITPLDSAVFPQKAGQMAVPISLNPQTYGQVSCGTDLGSLSVRSSSGACLSNGLAISSGMYCGGFSSLVKRQRLV